MLNFHNIRNALYIFIVFFLVLCNYTSISAQTNESLLNGDLKSLKNISSNIHKINSYISHIDFKSNNNNAILKNELVINGNERIITANESMKDVVLKDQSIVKVKYKNHLHNNFIKSKIFYYQNDALVCIKIIESIPNRNNVASAYKRTIYVEDNLAIADSDETNLDNTSIELVNLGLVQLKNEYLSL